MSKTVPFQTIQFSISTQFKCKYSLIVKNIYISSHLVNFVVRWNDRGKIKERVKIHKYMDLARELRKPGNIRVAVILIVIGVLGRFLKAWKVGWKSLKSVDELQFC